MSDTRLDYAILISLAMREEAEVMASALRAEGIDAFTSSISYDWRLTLAFGGVQVFVPWAKLGEAKAVIRGRISEAAANSDGEPVARKDRYKVWLVIAWTVGASAYVHWLNSLPPAPVYELRVGRGEVFFAAPGELTMEEQEAVVLDYCRDNPANRVTAPGSGFRGIIPCGVILARN